MKGFKKVILIFISLFVMVSLSGCMNAQVDVVINGDGSADQNFTFIVDKEKYNEKEFNEYMEKLKEFKFVIEKQDRGDEIAVSAKVYLPRFRSVINPMTFADEKFEKLPIEYNSGWFYSEYVFDFEYDIKAKKDYLTNIGLEGIDESNVVFTVVTPNEAIETNADDYDSSNSRYLWKLNGDKEKIYLVVKTKNIINWAMTFGFPVLLAIGLFNMRKEKIKEKKK